jgi:hypothetical protein
MPPHTNAANEYWSNIDDGMILSIIFNGRVAFSSRSDFNILGRSNPLEVANAAASIKTNMKESHETHSIDILFASGFVELRSGGGGLGFPF